VATGELKYWVAFHRISGLGPVRTGKLEARFGGLEAAWTASRSDLASAGLDAAVTREIVEQRTQIDPDSEMEKLSKAGVTAIHRRSPVYPALLAEAFDPPSVIYVRGTVTAADQRAVAIVGTRGPTAYGREVAYRLAYDLAAAGVTIASGLARGIDGVAHKAALDAGGRTIAVTGGGLESIYPPEHRDLARKIADSGAVISEYPLGVRPKAEHFPRRNRVISGLSLGVLVIEAGMDSGAMITVKWALEQDREVFAVPGSVLSPKSAGPNWLIQQGAKLVAESRDVLEELNIAVVRTAASPESDQQARQGQLGDAPQIGPAGPGLDRRVTKDDTEAKVFAALSAEPLHADELTRRTGLSAAVVSSTLALLELRGAVRQTGPMQYVADAGRPVLQRS
jgi:DNA processing protein